MDLFFSAEGYWSDSSSGFHRFNTYLWRAAYQSVIWVLEVEPGKQTRNYQMRGLPADAKWWPTLWGR